MDTPSLSYPIQAAEHRQWLRQLPDHLRDQLAKNEARRFDAWQEPETTTALKPTERILQRKLNGQTHASR